MTPAKRDDGDMSADEYRDVIAQLGFETHEAAAAALGVSLRTSKSYANGPWGIPPATAKLLRLWLAIKQGRSIKLPF